MTANHTPLPFKLPLYSVKFRGRITISDDGGNQVCSGLSLPVATAIVQACNAYPVLVDALHAARDALRNHVHPDDEIDMVVMDMINEALEKAGVK